MDIVLQTNFFSSSLCHKFFSCTNFHEYRGWILCIWFYFSKWKRTVLSGREFRTIIWCKILFTQKYCDLRKRDQNIIVFSGGDVSLAPVLASKTTFTHTLKFCRLLTTLSLTMKACLPYLNNRSLPIRAHQPPNTDMAPWCRGYHYCTSSFNKTWTQVLHRLKSCLLCVNGEGLWQWFWL